MRPAPANPPCAPGAGSSLVVRSIRTGLPWRGRRRATPADARQVVGESLHILEIEALEAFAMRARQRRTPVVDRVVELARQIGGVLAGDARNALVAIALAFRAV